MAITSARIVGAETPSASSAPEHLLNRARGDYEEMPGLQLTLRQASRFWNLDPDLTGALLTRLVDAGFLVRSHNGQYRRL